MTLYSCHWIRLRIQKKRIRARVGYIYLIFKSAQKKVGGVLKYFTLGRATKMAALLYLFFNNPPNKKKSPYIKNG